MAALPLPVGSYSLPAPAASCRRLVNCYAEQVPPEQPRGQPINLVRAPGIAPFADTEETEVRGAIMMGDTLFAVAGTSIYSISPGGFATQLSGDAITGNGVVRV